MTETVVDPDRIIRALQGAYGRGAHRAELLQIAATKLRQSGAPYTGVYIYMLRPDGGLELEAFDGRPTQHTHIPAGRGLCGRAVTERRDLNVPDVAATPEYLACSAETRSELIVLIRRGEEILGQIDVDSDVPSGFDQAEQAAVKDVADALAALV